jgi:hypothetical protein
MFRLRSFVVAFATVLILPLPAAVASAAAATEEAVPTATVLPTTVQVDALLRSITSRMLDKSPTFRRQCQIIGASGSLVVKVRVVPGPKNTLTRAVTTFRRYTSGLTVADVEIPAASQLVELLAHEFEHIAEYVEGVDLKALVRDRPREAYSLRDGSFETARAVRAGRVAAAEVERK